MDQFEFSRCFSAAFTENGMEKYVKEEYIEKFYRLTVRMLEVNAYMNLTAITELPSVVVRHYVDSLTVSEYLPQGARVVDIGCGAGFPTLPLAIVRPDLEILALDSTAKRVQYVAETAEMLGLSNVKAISCRAETARAKMALIEKCLTASFPVQLPICLFCLSFVCLMSLWAAALWP
jgi:16S rRNA G527 N7-methylase RsmG